MANDRDHSFGDQVRRDRHRGIGIAVVIALDENDGASAYPAGLVDLLHGQFGGLVHGAADGVGEGTGQADAHRIGRGRHAARMRTASAAARCAGRVIRLRLGYGRAGSDFADVGSLKPLRTFDDLKLDLVSFAQRPEAVLLNGRVVHEHVLATFLGDEPKALRIIEPLHRALRHCGHLLLSGSPRLRGVAWLQGQEKKPLDR